MKTHLTTILAITTLCATIGLLFLYKKKQHKGRKEADEDEGSTAPLQRAHDKNNSEEVFDEQMNRTILYYGEDAFNKIKSSFVIVVGVGGVGSAAAHVILRSGVRRIRLIDPVAQRKDVGRMKVQVMKEYFHNICPEASVETYETFFTEEMAPTLLSGNPDYVLDCIDNRNTKVELMAYCKLNNIKLISAFGAGSAHDPTKIKVCDLKDSFGCVFGKAIRRDLRARGIHEGILVVVSTEQEKKKLIKLTEEELKIAMEQDVKRNVRISKIGVSMPIPNVSVEEYGVFDVARYLVLLLRIACSVPLPNFQINDVKYLMDLFGGVSTISGEVSGTGRMIRWRASLGISLSNIVYMTKKEYDLHLNVTDVDRAYPKDLVKKIDELMIQTSSKNL